MARATQLRPGDHIMQSLLADAVRDPYVTHADIGELAGMPQNRVSIILKVETPPATVGEVPAIAHTIGRSGSEFITATEAEVAFGHRLEGDFSTGSAVSPQQCRNDDVVPDWSTTAAGTVYGRREHDGVGQSGQQTAPAPSTDVHPDHHDGTCEES